MIDPTSITNTLELLRVVNPHRVREGKAIMKHRTLVKKLYTHCGEKIGRGTIDVPPDVRTQGVRTIYATLITVQEVVVLLNKEGITVEGYQVVNKSNRLEFLFSDLLKSAFPDLEVVPQYNVGSYQVDFFLPDYNISVEYYEDYHKNPSQVKKDLSRQREIIRKTGCTFIVVRQGEEGKGIIDIHNTLKSIN